MQVNRAVMTDAAADAELSSEGYVVIDLLDADTAAALRTRWETAEREFAPVWDPTGLAASVRHPGRDVRADDLIGPVVQAALDPHVVDVVPFMSTFLAKRAMSGELPAHLDWRLLDEVTELTHGCWVALEDVDASNGALGVLPGSHRLVDFDRTPESPGHDWVERHLTGAPTTVVLELRAGQAVIYDHRLVHFSPPNASPSPRVATNSGLCRPHAAEQARRTLLDMMARGMAGAGSAPQIPDALDR